MAFPAKFRDLLENSEHSATVPDEVWLSFAVCGCEQDSCGWTGWIIESAWHKKGRDGPRKTGIVRSADNQKCPNCNKQTFRTALEKEYVLNPIQRPKLDFEYEVIPPIYDDEVDGS